MAIERSRPTGVPTRTRGPFGLPDLRRRMNRLFSDFWLTPFEEPATLAGEFMPAVNVKQTDDSVTVSAELPGIDKNDVDVTVTEDSVRISGSKKQEAEEEKENYYWYERSYGSFDRVVDLPVGVDKDKAEAEFNKGVLNIKIPKLSEEKTGARKVQVKSE